MLSYRHAFHAGNFADVVKHAVLVAVIEALKQKDTPLCYLDTHSGAGRYDLRAGPAEKTGEWRDGIKRLWTRDDVPPALASYLRCVREFNTDGVLREYPGSPRLARTLLRPQDRMVLMELHNTEYPILKREFAGDSQVAVHHLDGYVGIKGHLPPKEKRGVLLIDPSYETQNEFRDVADALKRANERWPTGVLCLWYPVLARYQVNELMHTLRGSGLREVLRVELNVLPDDAPPGLHGCGMIVIRPPWKLDVTLRDAMPWLREVLAQSDTAQWTVEWVVGE